MKIWSRQQRGYALVMTLMFVAISLLALGATLRWNLTNTQLSERNNQWLRNSAAAEAASELALAHVSADFMNQGEAEVYRNLGKYQKMVPDKSQDASWNQFEFCDSDGKKSRSNVERITTSQFVELNSIYRGLLGLSSTYKIHSVASEKISRFQIPAGVEQEIQLASIPIFQFAIFYTVDLEINPGAEMNITGKVHSNQNIYLDPNGVPMVFENDLTSDGNIYPAKKPNDPVTRAPGRISYMAAHDSKVSALTLPIGTNNTPEAVRAIIEMPATDEKGKKGGSLAEQRYYNKADMVILVTDLGPVATSGSLNDFKTQVPLFQLTNFVSTNALFYSFREGKTIKATEFNVAAFRSWSMTNLLLRTLLKRDIDCVYIADLRSQTASTEPGVRVVNGQLLPPLGLTIATPQPLYVKGHFNAPDDIVGTSSTMLAKPASLVGDAITILSSNWNDANSAQPLSARPAADVTINAAFLGGITETANGFYSGGVENFPRFMEDWSGKKVTYNGSMVVMFPSRIAVGPWGQDAVYVPPMRDWTFDRNFLDVDKLPPATPQLLRVLRGKWALAAP
jgi:hypothetical protein